MSLLPTPPKSICIFRLSAIGDVCHTLPVLRTLQATWPSSKITWVIGKTEAQLLANIPNVEFIIFDKSLGSKAYTQLKTNLNNREFDVLLMMQAALRASIASLYINAKLKIGFDKDRAKDFQWLFSKEKITPQKNSHVMDGLFGFCKALDIDYEVHAWNIPLSETDLEFAHSFTKSSKTALISPCSSERKNNFRNWSIENFSALCIQLINKGYQVVLTGGPSEKELHYGEGISKLCKSPRLKNLIGETSLKQLYALISEVDLVIAPDSGPIHMANSAATPCIGLYASSNPQRTGPYHQQHLVVNKYPEAVKNFLNKEVSDIKWGQRVRNAEVMSLITVDDVLNKIVLFESKTNTYIQEGT